MVAIDEHQIKRKTRDSKATSPESSSTDIQLRTEPANIQLQTEHADGQIIGITSAVGQIEHADGQSERQIELAKRQIEHADGKI